MEQELGNTQKQERVHIEVEKVEKQVPIMANWKSPRSYRVQGFWIKQLTSTHNRIRPHLEECLQDKNVTKCIVSGKTVLCVKK